MIDDALCALGDAVSWAGDALITPIVTGVAVGFALRGAAILGEINDHDARVAELDIDLTRWVSDRERQLAEEIWRARTLARQGQIGTVQRPLPPALKDTTPGSQVDSGAFVGRVGSLMRKALHEYRDEASRKVRAYRVMARSEGRLHQLLRRSGKPGPLGLSKQGRATLATWRERPVPAFGSPSARVEAKDDPTRALDAVEIQPLEDESGLTWKAAQASNGSINSN